MDGPDDLLEEPLLLNGAFIRRWDELARLPRPDDLGSGDVPRPRTPGPSSRVTEPAAD